MTFSFPTPRPLTTYTPVSARARGGAWGRAARDRRPDCVRTQTNTQIHTSIDAPKPRYTRAHDSLEEGLAPQLRRAAGDR